MTLSNGQLYKSLFENMLNGFAHCKAIYNDAGEMIDWIYLETNHAFEVQTGLVDVFGKRVTEVIHDIANTDKELFEIYGRISKGVARYEHFEYFVATLGIWFNITAYSVEVGTFTVVFQNINEHKKQIMELEKANHDVLMAMLRTLKFRDKETDIHSERVTSRALDFARYLGMSEDELNCVYKGSLMHDIGKMFVADKILQKPDKLTLGERTIMQLHPQNAYDLLSPIPSLAKCLDIPYCHHEKWDGSGYPRGLKGKDIPFTARMFSIVDVYDALTSDRPYRDSWTKQATLDYIKANAGTCFDPELVAKFIEMME